MKRYILALALMVICGSILIALVARLQPPERGEYGYREAVDRGAERSIENVVEMVGPAVVAINTRGKRLIRPWLDELFYPFPGNSRSLLAETEGIGSGVIFDPDGYVLTNAHVVERVHEIMVTLADGRQMKALLCGRDLERDLAVIKLSEKGLPVAEFGDSDRLSMGQWVLAFGNPFGTASRSAQPSVTVGVISALHRNLRVRHNRFYRNLIQTDAAINFGNDGGPLVDLRGKVIGLNTLIVTSSGASTSVGFAIPINLVKESLEELKR